MDKDVISPGIINRPAKSVISLSCFVLLAACQTSGLDDLFSNVLPKKSQDQQVASATPQTGTNPHAKNKLINTTNSLTDYCPAVRIRSGTEYLRIFKGKDQENPDNLRYQATLTKVARECAYRGENLEIRVGALGRIIAGPSGGAGAFQLPIRVAVQQGGCSRHFELHQQHASMAEGATHSKFEFIDQAIIIPAPKATNVRIFLGFDETPNAKSSAQPCES